MSVVRIADYLMCYRHQAKQLVTLISSAYTEEKPRQGLNEKRLMYFYIVNETIFRSKEKGFEYIKAFGDQLNDWVDIFANSGCDEFALLDALVKVIQIWEDEFIFSKSFTDLLKSQLRTQLDMAMQKQY